MPPVLQKKENMAYRIFNVNINVNQQQSTPSNNPQSNIPMDDYSGLFKNQNGAALGLCNSMTSPVRFIPMHNHDILKQNMFEKSNDDRSSNGSNRET